LVVIAIVGVLSALVLVSVNSARAKAKDTRVQSNLRQVKTILTSAALDGSLSELNCSTTTCSTLSVSENQKMIARLATDINNLVGDPNHNLSISASFDNTTWFASSGLPSVPTKAAFVSSSGSNGTGQIVIDASTQNGSLEGVYLTSGNYRVPGWWTDAIGTFTADTVDFVSGIQSCKMAPGSGIEKLVVAGSDYKIIFSAKANVPTADQLIIAANGGTTLTGNKFALTTEFKTYSYDFKENVGVSYPGFWIKAQTGKPGNVWVDNVTVIKLN
jgi:type II secretory pathway pseudopilin PulG